MAAATAFAFPNSTGIFSTLGGSNTLGACDTAGKLRCNQTAFSRLTFDSLQSLHAVDNWVNGGIGAMGPELAAACTQKFAPEGTRMATIEYLPNLGYTNDDVRELAAIERLLHYLQRRGARVAFVNILPGKAMPRMVHCRDGQIGCTTRNHIERLDKALKQLAEKYYVPTVTMDRDGADGASIFNDDFMHLNQKGHEAVRDELIRLYREWPHWQKALDTSMHDADATRAANLMPLVCHMGDELQPLIGQSHGFRRVNFARDQWSRADKIGYQATTAGSSLTLCTGFPPEPPSKDLPLPQWAKLGPTVNQSTKEGLRHVIAVGMQISHDLNLPLFGVAKLSCAGACKCVCRWSHHGAFNESCLFDGLAKGRATVTAFLRLLASRESPPPAAPPALGAGEGGGGKRLHPERACAHDQCALTISNSADPNDRLRVILRSLMVGYNQHHSSKWLNTYYLDGVGLTDYRRKRRERR